jgi:hypothetical protein
VRLHPCRKGLHPCRPPQPPGIRCRLSYLNTTNTHPIQPPGRCGPAQPPDVARRPSSAAHLMPPQIAGRRQMRTVVPIHHATLQPATHIVMRPHARVRITFRRRAAGYPAQLHTAHFPPTAAKDYAATADYAATKDGAAPRTRHALAAAEPPPLRYNDTNIIYNISTG